jgi:hypothetical protein
MRGRAFNLLAAGSTLFFLTIVVLWIRSFYMMDMSQHYTTEQAGEEWELRKYELASWKGRLFIGNSLEDTLDHPSDDYRRFAWNSVPVDTINGMDKWVSYRFGFAYRKLYIRDAEAGSFGWVLMLPYWAIAIIFASVPSLWLRKRLFGRNKGRGFEVSTRSEK